jgi:hypothetical protein
MSVTKIVTFTTSAMTPPAASTRLRILAKNDLGLLVFVSFYDISILVARDHSRDVSNAIYN